MVLAAECSTQGMDVKRSFIPHPASGLGVFAASPFGKGQTITYNYGSLVYAGLYRQ